VFTNSGNLGASFAGATFLDLFLIFLIYKLGL
jgi:hypothetical protein